MEPIEISQQLLLAAKTNAYAGPLLNLLANIANEKLASDLNTDDRKKTFWINIYNAVTQINISRNSSLLNDRRRFFGNRHLFIAQMKMSLDDVEHGMLRRSKVKWSRGYLNKPFPATFERSHRVDKLDYRIHFALNCGAVSCPSIAFYDPEGIHKQLEDAATNYLKSEVEYDAKKNIVALPAIMSWYRHDFGGKHNMKAILQRFQIIPGNTNPKITFKKYNWNLFAANYKMEDNE